MKFTKEDAYKELVAKMTAKGEKLNLSERSINEQLENLISLVATEEIEMSDFVEKILPLIKTADNNVRNDVSVGINKYKEDNPPKQTADPNPQAQNGQKSELEKRLELLEKELATEKQRQFTENTRKSLSEKLKDKGVKNEEWISNLLREVVISEDFNVDEKVESYLRLYNISQSDVNPNATPQGANAKGKPDVISDTIKQAAALAKSQNLINN